MLRSWFFGNSFLTVSTPTFKASLEQDPNDKRYPWFVRFVLGNQDIQVVLRADIRLGMETMAIDELTMIAGSLRHKDAGYVVKFVGNTNCFFRPSFEMEETEDLQIVFRSLNENRALESFRVIFAPEQASTIINEIEAVIKQIELHCV